MTSGWSLPWEAPWFDPLAGWGRGLPAPDAAQSALNAALNPGAESMCLATSAGAHDGAGNR